MPYSNLERTIDNALLLRAASEAAVTATGAHSVVVDLGPGYHKFDVYIDVTAIEVASNDELYRIQVLGSNDDFVAESIVLGSLPLGALEVLVASTDSTVGVYTLPCHNLIGGSSPSTLRKIKIGYVITGTVATGIDFMAWAAKRT